MKRIYSLLAVLFLFCPQIFSQTLNNGVSASPAVVYSLRPLINGYSGHALKVMRWSDKAEANVDFGGSAISTASAVTITSGVTVTASLGTSRTGTISTVASKTGTVTVVVNKSGTLSAAQGSTAVTGSGTSFATELVAGDLLYTNTNAFLGIVKSIQSGTSLTLNNGSLISYASTFRTNTATVTGSGTNFTGELAVGDRLFLSTNNTYLGTVASIPSATSLKLNSIDAVTASGAGFVGTSATVTGAGTDFSTGDVGKLLISNNITLGIVLSVSSATSLTLKDKAGAAVAGTAFKDYTVPTTLETFAGSSNVSVTTWYDQSGNGRDAVQLTAANQPKLMTAGVLNMVNSKPALAFSSSSLRTSSAATWLAGTLYTLNCVSAEATANVNTSNYSFLMSTTGYGGPNNTISHFGYRTPNQYTVAQYGQDVNFTTQATTSLETHTAVKSSATQSYLYKNGVTLGTLSNAGATNLADLGLFNIGYYTPVANAYFSGSISEIIIFGSALSSGDRTVLDNNQVAYFGIASDTWTGTTDTDWFKTTNWSSGVVPTASSPAVVYIPNVTNKPLISGATTAEARSIVIDTGSSLTVTGTLKINGAVSMLGTLTATAGTIELNGTESQTFSNGTAVNNLIINNSAGVSLSGNLTVSNNLTFTAGYLSILYSTLTLGGTVTNTLAGGLWGGTNASMIITGSPTISFNQNGTYNILKSLTINGSGAVATLGSNLILNGTGTTTFTNGKLAIGSNTLYVRGAVVNTVAGGLRGNGSSNVIVDGILSPTLSFDQTTPGTTNALNNLTVATTAADSVMIDNNLSVNGALTINALQKLKMGTAALGGTLATITNNGTISTQNTGSMPLSTGKTWGGTVNYNSASTAQTVASGTYNNLTISTIGGATAGGDLTVNGILNLSKANPSTTKGCLEMVTDWGLYPITVDNLSYVEITSSYILTMGSASSTTGPGDVTGKVKRTTIAANTSYSFGNQFTTLSITPGSEASLPTDLTVTIKIGTAPPGKTDAVKRYFQILPSSGSSNCFLNANFHYLDAELNKNDESKLTTWDYDIGGGSDTPDEHGRASYDTSNNYVGLSNIPISYFIYVSGTHAWRTMFTMGIYQAGYSTWNGSVSTDWNHSANWTPAGVPTVLSMIVIPSVGNTSSRSPVLPNGTTTINTISIQSGGVLVMGSNTLTIQNTLSAGWEDQNTGGNDPGTSKVIFATSGSAGSGAATVSGTGKFYDVEIANGASVTLASASKMMIGNNITKTGTGKWYADVNDGTVEYYKSGDQTVVMPDGTPHYHELILSGSGTKTMPPASMTLHGNLTLSGTASATAAGALTIGGNLTLDSGTSFTAGTFGHSLGGNFLNNGATFTATGSTFTLNGTGNQSIGGTTSSTFSNLIIDATANVTLAPTSDSRLTTASGNLTINSGGKLTIPVAQKLTIEGTTTNNSATGINILSDANGTGSLITAGAGGTGSTYVQRYMSPSQWFVVSAPAIQSIGTFLDTNVDIPVLNDGSTSYTYAMMDYNTEVNNWNAYFSDAVNPGSFSAGKGYIIRTIAPLSLTVSYTGTLNAGSTPVSVARTGNYGWNCVGNPFTSTINMNTAASTASGGENFLNVNSTLIDPSYTGVYFWNDITSVYDIVNLADAASYAQSGQGFFVKAVNSGTLSFTTAMQVHQNAVALKSSPIPYPEIKLLASNNGKMASTSIRFISGMTNGLDIGYDAGAFKTDPSFALYTKLVNDNGVDFQLQCLPDNDFSNLIIPVGVDSQLGGEIIFSSETINLPLNCRVILEDRLTKTFTDLSKGIYKAAIGAYTASANRFFIHTADVVSGVESILPVNKLTVYPVYNVEIKVAGNVSDQAVAYLYDIVGRLIMVKKLESGNLNSITIPFLTKGIYLLKVKDLRSVQTFKLPIKESL